MQDPLPTQNLRHAIVLIVTLYWDQVKICFYHQNCRQVLHIYNYKPSLLNSWKKFLHIICYKYTDQSVSLIKYWQWKTNQDLKSIISTLHEYTNLKIHVYPYCNVINSKSILSNVCVTCNCQWQVMFNNKRF